MSRHRHSRCQVKDDAAHTADIAPSAAPFFKDILHKRKSTYDKPVNAKNRTGSIFMDKHLAIALLNAVCLILLLSYVIKIN